MIDIKIGDCREVLKTLPDKHFQTCVTSPPYYGLRDYGKLVIIKHSDYLLSAYGHNQKLLVSEGQVVDESEIISKLGSTGRLYFEIRKNGKPVNPMAYIN